MTAVDQDIWSIPVHHYSSKKTVMKYIDLPCKNIISYSCSNICNILLLIFQEP